MFNVRQGGFLVEENKKYNTLTLKAVKGLTDAEKLDVHLQYLLKKQSILQQTVREKSDELQKVNEEILYVVRKYMEVK